MWIRADNAFEAIVVPQIFFKAQGIIQERDRRFTDEQMLDRLKHLLDHHGYLSGFIIDESGSAPSSDLYQRRFGSLIRAYELVGFKPDRDYRYIEINRALRKLHKEVVLQTIDTIESLGGQTTRNSESDLLTINGEFTASIVVARCQQTSSGSLRWKIRLARISQTP